MEFNSEVFNKLLEQGVFLALFVALFIYVIKTTEQRELMYQKLLNEVTSSILCETRSGTATSVVAVEGVERANKTLTVITQKVDVLDNKVDKLDRKVEILSIHLEKE